MIWLLSFKILVKKMQWIASELTKEKSSSQLKIQVWSPMISSATKAAKCRFDSRSMNFLWKRAQNYPRKNRISFLDTFPKGHGPIHSLKFTNTCRFNSSFSLCSAYLENVVTSNYILTSHNPGCPKAMKFSFMPANAFQAMPPNCVASGPHSQVLFWWKIRGRDRTFDLECMYWQLGFQCCSFFQNL